MDSVNEKQMGFSGKATAAAALGAALLAVASTRIGCDRLLRECLLAHP
jgi:hypothetical protein